MLSPIDDGDSTQIKPGNLVGLLLGDAIKKHVILDRDVQAAGAGVINYDFGRMEFSRAYNRSLWPIDLPITDLASKFVTGGGELDALIPEKVEKVAELIIDRYAKLVSYLRAGDVVAIDMDNKPIDRIVWQGPDLAIDIHRSDLYEIPGLTRWRQGYHNSENRLLSSRLRLSQPERRTADTVRSLGPKSGDPGIKPHRKLGAKKGSTSHTVSDVYRDSIERAMEGIWGKKEVPPNLFVKERDSKIADYQKEKRLKVSSVRTNRRFFGGK